MSPLDSLIRARILAEGPISLGAFMEIALLHPEHGYYLSREPFGPVGDFVTAPEVTPLFGEAVGRWLAAVWKLMGAPRPVWLMELGPGRGTLIAHALRQVADEAPDCLSAVRLCLVEASPRLVAQQAAAIARVASDLPVSWQRDLGELPPGPMVLIANEFFDALPICQYVRTAAGWRERRIGLDPATDALGFIAGPVLSLPPPLPPFLADASENEPVEVCPAGEDLARRVAAHVARDGGAALIVDFGPARSAPGDSFQAVRGHRYADPLADPGTADLAHHVDFAALALAAETAGARVHGPIAQGLWLGRMGVVERAAELSASNPEGAAGVAAAIRRLLHPGQMGVLFKALAIAHPALPVPPGFARGQP